MQKRVIALNSGGFDSVTLLHYLKYHLKREVISLFFDYGQRSAVQEEKCARAVCEKLGFEFRKVVIPKFDWDVTSLYDSSISIDAEGQYVPFRNVVLLSYALSFAEALKVDDIYSAIINAGYYNDTTPEFQRYIAKFYKKLGFKCLFPFSHLKKSQLPFYSLRPTEYFSCNVPNEMGQACGVCNDCLKLD